MDLPGRRRASYWSLIHSWTLLEALIAVIQVSTGQSNSAGSDGSRMRRIIKVATIQMEPYVHLNWSPGLIANERYEGMFIDLLKEMIEEAGFDYQLYLVPDGKIGHIGDNEQWNGLIGELERGSADLALAPIIATPERRQAAHFLPALSRVKISLLSRDPIKRDLPFGVVLPSEALYALKTDPRIYEQIRRHRIQYASSIMEGLERAREGLCNLLLTEQIAEYYADQQPCDLIAEPFHDFDDLVYGVAASGRDEIYDQLSTVLARMLTGGTLMARLEQTWIRGSCMRHGTLPTSLGTTVNTDTQKMWSKLIITSIMVEPYLMRSTKPGVQFEGYIADLVHQVAGILSVSYEWRIQRRVGREKKDGRWSGMIGEILDGNADVVAAPFVVHNNQKSVLSFSKPFLESTLSILIKAPPEGGEAPPIVMIENLINQSTYDYGVVHKSRLARQLRLSQLPLYKQLWRRLKEKDRKNRIRTLTEGIRKVQNGQFALVIESPEATFLASREPCDLMSVSQYLTVMAYTFATVKDSPLVDHLNLALLQLQEAGVLQALFHKWWNADQCGYETERGHTQAETTTTMTTESTPRASVAPPRPRLDFDIDQMLGLATKGYPETGNVSEYEGFGGNPEDQYDYDPGRDLDRIFLTSPVSAFTPSKPVRDVIALPTASQPVTTTTGSLPATRANVVHFENKNNATRTTPTRYKTTEDGFAEERIKENLTILSPKYNITDRAPETTFTGAVTSSITPVNRSTMRKERRKGRTRRPRKRKGRRRSTTPMVTTSVISTTTTKPSTTTTRRPRSRDFNRNINWFFVTQLPRPEDYDDYDSFNLTRGDNFTGITPHQIQTDPTDPIGETATPTDVSVRSVAPPSADPGTAVLVVVVIHLVIFGWPEPSEPCEENCRR